MKKFIHSLALIFMLFTGPARGSEIIDTSSVWQHHINAWNARDAREIASDYDESSVLIINGKAFHGPKEIEAAFQKLFGIFDLGENSIDPAVIDGDVIYLTWHFAPIHEAVVDGTDTFFVEGGRIKAQTIASRLYQRFPVKQ